MQVAAGPPTFDQELESDAARCLRRLCAQSAEAALFCAGRALKFSGYENFVSRMNLSEQEDRPEWQGEVDFSGLKLKLVASIVAISGIHLLKVFMDVGKYGADQIRWMVVIHLVFVISGVLLAAMDWISSHGKGLKKRAPKA